MIYYYYLPLDPSFGVHGTHHAPRNLPACTTRTTTELLNVNNDLNGITPAQQYQASTEILNFWVTTYLSQLLIEIKQLLVGS